MTDRPEDIPQDVWDAAQRISLELPIGTLGQRTLQKEISRALAEARSQAYEECAKIADDMADAWAEASKKLSDAGMISDGTIRAASLGARDVSQAIRSKANQ